MVTLLQPVLQHQSWPLFNSSSPARMIFLSSKFSLFMPLLRIIYGFPLLQDEVRITQCDKCQCYKTLPFPGLVSFHTLQACPTIDPFSNVVSFQNSVLWYILSPLARNTLDPHWEDLTKYHLSSKTHLRENCHELPQFDETSFMSCHPPCASFHPKHPLPSIGLRCSLACLHDSYFSHINKDCHSASSMAGIQ